MGSVQGTIKCPKCEGEMVYDYYYNTREEYRTCFRCGYKQRWELERNPDSTLKKGEDGKLIMNYTEVICYGVISLRHKDGAGCLYSLQKPLSDSEKEALLKEFQRDDVEDGSYAVLYDPENNTFSALAGSIPGGYEDALPM